MRSFSLIIPGFALAALCFAQQPQQNGSALEGKKPGTLEGRVLNSVTGEPVRRVNLVLRPFGAAGMVGFTRSGPVTPAAPFAATTDAEGKFRLEKVEPGAYRLMAERQGFVRQEYGARRNSMMGTTITVAAGQELKDLTIKLTPQAVVKGRVLDDEGEPLAHVQIQVLTRRFFRGKQQMMPMGGGQTIDTGEFRLSDLAPGRYWISAVYHSRMAMYGEVPARNTTGQPEEDYVTTYYPSATSESDARPIDVDAGQEMSGVDIRLRKARVFRIRGKISGGAQPARRVRVFLMPRERGSFMGGFGGAGGMVKEDGTFEIGGVQPGSYYVAAAPAQGMMTVQGKTPVDVAREDVENVTLTLGGGATLSGAIRVTGDTHQTPPNETKKPALGTIRVQLMSMDGMAFNTPGATAKDDGSFLLENAGPERYRITVFNLPPGLWLKSIRAGDQELIETGVDLSAGAPGQIEIVLDTGVGQVSGMVRDTKKQPAPGGMVTLIPDPLKEDRTDLFKMISVDQNGQYTLQNIAPGDYRLFAWEDIDPGQYMDPEFLKKHESGAAKVTVKANAMAQVNLAQIAAEATGVK
ncbi:MAG: carboxypeptidase regulatory-like domain-containing protein [Bryobacteraceae bacterium]